MTDTTSPHILIVADGRSPTTRSWISTLQTLEFQVSLISTFDCPEPEDMAFFAVLPVAFSQFSSENTSSKGLQKGKKAGIGRLVSRNRNFFQKLRYWLGPLSLSLYTRLFVLIIGNIQPDIVHALRIPYEGMLALNTPVGIPLVISTWGNDLTLHAGQSPLMRKLTRKCLTRADGLLSDSQRDINLARQWGLREEIPTLLVPGSGGLDLERIRQVNPENYDWAEFNLPSERPLAVNSRGYRPGYVHQDVFFAAIPLVLEKIPDLVFICPGLAGGQAEEWVARYKIEQNVILLPSLPQDELWALNKKCMLFISPSSHDGTPNTLIESMACGCFPVAGDIASIREWIEPGKNGLLVDPHDTRALADAIIQAVSSPDLRAQATEINHRVVHEKAALEITRPKIKAFYDALINEHRS
jgi:glycosyltransferase involved in cell wall biosynthesis